MTFRDPSYITKTKHGVYYFQFRVPKFYADRLGLDKRLLRKSLKTKNRRLALSIASRIWSRLSLLIYLEHPMSDKSKGLKQLESLFEGEAHILAEDFKHTQHISTAIKVTDRYSEISELNTYDLEMFWDSLAEYELEALRYVSENGVNLDIYRAKEKIDLGQATYKSHLASEEIRDTSIEKLLEAYLTYCEGRKSSAKTINLYRDQIKLFCDLTNVKFASEVDIEAVELFAHHLPKVPKNRKKMRAYRDHSLETLLTMQIPEDDLLAENTVATYATNVKAFLDWSVKRKYCYKGITVSLEGAFSKAKSYPFLRFNDDDLSLLFLSERYLRGTHTNAAHYWIPLIALFTGARQNEICQLSNSEIKEVEKRGSTIYYFDFNDEDEKQLKN